jgi:hypothetical protein
MTNVQPAPPAKSSDALNRAVRTFLQGLVVTIAGSLVTALVTVSSGVQWTRAYWVGVGIAAGTSVVTGVASYIARYIAPPQP